MRRLSWFLMVSVFLGSVSALLCTAQIKEPHQGTLGDDCQDCHTLDGWKPSTFTVERHQSVAFPLKGKHADVECTRCHTDSLFKATLTDCFSCHRTTDLQDGHRGELGKDCASCHSEIAWPDHRFDLARHQQTSFPLKGRHQKVKCLQCHQERVYRIKDQTCIDCHRADNERVHRGQLGSECTDCHTVDDWAPSTYDHATRPIQKIERSRARHWLAWLLPEFLTPKDRSYSYYYVLIGKHADVECAQCHAEHRYRNTNTDCISCHRQHDAHAARLGENCGRCHSPNGWPEFHFDHSLAGFELVGQHAHIPCESCHGDDKYHEVSRDCQQCHASDTTHAQDTTSECALCHTPTDWRMVSFEHDGLRFPLEGRHAQADCTDCHAAESFRGLNDQCIQCHEDPHGGDFGTECGVCHTPITWQTAVFNHDATGFPLTGKHHGLDCGNCHQLPGYKGLRAECRFCHEQDSPANHFGPTCGDCHSTSAWTPASFQNFDHNAFPIDRGHHRGLSCNRCHTVPGDYHTFSCISGGCHPRAQTNGEHEGEVRGYVYESTACYRCHPNGREDD